MPFPMPGKGINYDNNNKPLWKEHHRIWRCTGIRYCASPRLDPSATASVHVRSPLTVCATWQLRQNTEVNFHWQTGIKQCSAITAATTEQWFDIYLLTHRSCFSCFELCANYQLFRTILCAAAEVRWIVITPTLDVYVYSISRFSTINKY